MPIWVAKGRKIYTPPVVEASQVLISRLTRAQNSFVCRSLTSMARARIAVDISPRSSDAKVRRSKGYRSVSFEVAKCGDGRCFGRKINSGIPEESRTNKSYHDKFSHIPSCQDLQSRHSTSYTQGGRFRPTKKTKERTKRPLFFAFYQNVRIFLCRYKAWLAVRESNT